MDYLNEFQQVQEQLTLPTTQPRVNVWKPPPSSIFKLNFDAAIFADLNCSGFGAIICNERGEVIAAMSTKGPLVANNKEAEILAYQQALEFSIDFGFTELIIEGDNANVMRSLSSQVPIHIARMCLW